MAYYDKLVNGFVGNQNAEGTLYECTDEQFNDIMQQVASGNMRLDSDTDGRPIVVPRPGPTAEEKQAQYERRVDGLIRLKFTISQELAILRQKDSKSQEYKAYFDYCEECKTTARKEVYGNEI